MKERPQSEREQLAAWLGVAERLAAVGRVAAGVAHELNDPLTYVLANLELALRELPPGAPAHLRELISEAREGAARVRDIARDLRLFTQGGSERGVACDPVEVLRSAMAVVRNDLRHRAALVVDAPPAPRVALPAGRLAQALLNLLTRAAHAIPAGRAESNRIAVTVRALAGEVEVAVTDTGPVLTDEERAQLFEPFAPGRAVEPGLGLALARAIVTEAGGRIEVEPGPDRGAVVRVLLPLAEHGASPTATASGHPTAGAGRRRVLVVDDEPLVGRAVARLLRDCHVDVVSRGDEALAILGRGEPYDVVLCDLMMPEMSGMELHARVAERDPDLAGRFVFLTGGAFTDVARRFVARTDVRVVDKPVDPDALRAAVVAARGRPGG